MPTSAHVHPSQPLLLPARAVLFDMDGLLLDTEPLWYTAERLTATWLGWDYTDRDHAELIGIDLWRTAEYLRSRAPAAIRDAATVEAVAERVTRELKYQARHYGAKARPGAAALVTGLRLYGHQLATALVTSSERQFMYSVLAHARMHFGAYIDAQAVTEPKPAPDPYLAAAAALDLDPADCIALEDSPAGVASAVEAKCGTVIAVPSVPGQITEADGCLVLRSLDGLEAGPEGLTVRAGYLGDK
jgi:HAD superfamily hydrolase (TIGR01509 family)